MSSIKALRTVIFLPFLASALVSCAAPQLPPPPPKYVYEDHTAEAPETYPNNSLWVEQASLFEDPRARRLNDLVTINIVENITGTGQADTNASRQSSTDASVTNFFGTQFNGTIKPTLAGQLQNSFKGAAETDGTNTLTGTITAKVVEVMPNGNLLLEARKEITLNKGKQTLVLQGMARPYDIASNNSIPSTSLTDVKIYFVGDGVLQESQRPGWLARIVDELWPF